MVLFTIGHSPSLKRIKVLRHRVAESFIEKYNLRPLATEKEEVVGKTRLVGKFCCSCCNELDKFS